MNDFLTVEDINSVLLKYGGVNKLHSINTANIGSNEFEGVYYDFCIVAHTIEGSQHNFEFEVVNKLWTGGYYLTDANGNFLDINCSYQDGKISFETAEESVVLNLYLTNLATDFNFEQITWVSPDLANISLFYGFPLSKTFDIVNLDGSTPTGSVSFIYDEHTVNSQISNGKCEYKLNDGDFLFDGVIKITYNGCSYFIRPNFIKNVVPAFINTTLIASKVNTIEIDIPEFTEEINTGTVYFGDLEIPIDFNSSFSFELDLREKMDTRPISIKLKIDETSQTAEHTYDFVLPVEFKSISEFGDFKTELNDVNGARVMELASDIQCSSDITISHDTKIIGGGYGIDLDYHSIIIGENLLLKLNQIKFSNGNPLIIQKINSKLNAYKCKFENCSSSDYNNLGSVVLCDIDLESLSVTDDFETELNKCNFVNNHNCVLHGGNLNVVDCTYINNDLSYFDKNNVAFLYQVDGEAVLTNNVFDIDYVDPILCDNMLNIGFGQALFKCGLYSQINNYGIDNWKNGGNLPFCNNPYNNKCHIFAKYYYPKIETCVFASPSLGKEDKAFCYAVSEETWIFKENVEITRASSQIENNVRKIRWNIENELIEVVTPNIQID